MFLTIDGLFPGRPDGHSHLGRWPEPAVMTDFFAEFEERGDDYDRRAAG
ncbi:hypothetical protein AB0395_35785 [Streptosporangium sp. NPDC051023]